MTGERNEPEHPDEPDVDDGGSALEAAPADERSAVTRALVNDRNKRLMLGALRGLREILPGDPRFGDPLSTGGNDSSQAIARRIVEASEERPGLLREAGLGALQVWDAMTDGQARRGQRDIVIVFTDLVEFSSWAMNAGDDAALRLLRDVGEAIEPPVLGNRGEVVKRLGDGMMAAFEDPADALAAVLEARERLAEVRAEGYQPHIRAGMHLGRPQRIGGDYLGVDVNVAARIAEGAGSDELLVSETVLEGLDTAALKVRKKRFYRGKGVPPEIHVYSVRPG